MLPRSILGLASRFRATSKSFATSSTTCTRLLAGAHRGTRPENRAESLDLDKHRQKRYQDPGNGPANAPNSIEPLFEITRENEILGVCTSPIISIKAELILVSEP
jgi:hypothetical protein